MISITAQSMDELNKLYRKLKNHYRPVDKIKIDQSGLHYRLDLEEKKLKPLVKNQLDKVIDYYDELSEIDIISKDRFYSFLIENQSDVIIKQMLDLWNAMTLYDKSLAIEYLSEEIESDITEPA